MGKMNKDIFVVFWDYDDSTLRVRPRLGEDADDYDEDGEEEPEFVTRVLELLVSYKPPDGKRPSVMHRGAPEAFWVPARALLGPREQARLQHIAPRFSTHLSIASTDPDGLILRLLRHPRASNAETHLSLCVSQLAEALGSDTSEEAEKRLRADEKFFSFWEQFPLIEAGSQEEAAIARSLRSRVKVLADSHRLSLRVSAPWEEVRVALEKVKWYRQLLGCYLSAESYDTPGEEAEERLSQGLDVLVDSWPDLEKAKAPAASPASGKRKLDGADSSNGKRARRGNKGTSKGKAKGGHK